MQEQQKKKETNRRSNSSQERISCDVHWKRRKNGWVLGGRLGVYEGWPANFWRGKRVPSSYLSKTEEGVEVEKEGKGETEITKETGKIASNLQPKKSQKSQKTPGSTRRKPKEKENERRSRGVSSIVELTQRNY